MVSKRQNKRRTKASSGDREAAALVWLGIAVLLALSLYPESPISGQVGLAIKNLLFGTIGAVAWLLPWPFLLTSIFLLLRRPLGPIYRVSGLILLAGLISLPLLAFFNTGLGGEAGILATAWLERTLGTVGLLLPVLALTLPLDLMLRRIPGSLLLAALKRSVLAGARLLRELLALIRTRRARARQLRLLREFSAELAPLLTRYPDHRVLLELDKELTAFSRNPDVDPGTPDHWATLLDSFSEARATELLERIKTEPQQLSGQLHTWQGALAAAPDKPGTEADPLVVTLEERRNALLLELKALEDKQLRLNKQAQASQRTIQERPRPLEPHWQAHERRREAWAQTMMIYADFKTRAERWIVWAMWYQDTPISEHTHGLKVLLAQGLDAEPPATSAVDEQSASGPESMEIDLASLEPDHITVEDLQPDKLRETKQAVDQPPSAQPILIAPPSKLTLPPRDLLDALPGPSKKAPHQHADSEKRAAVINQTLAHFGLSAKVMDWARGPTVTRFEVEPAPGEKISRIASLATDLARTLAVGSLRVEAPIPGKSVIGLEVPNAERDPVRFAEAISHPSYQRSTGLLPIVLGKSIDGEMWIGDLARMPHLLIAGSTGAGKSVCINTLLVSLLYRYLPTELRFLMVDPKMVELTPYNGIPHLVREVVTNPAGAADVLLGAVTHMESRYKLMSQMGTRNLEQFNEKRKAAGEPTLPYLVIVIDELADLMITSPKEVEQAILRLAQMSRATGMHLLLATQRPSVDILTSLIKINVPARIAFAVSSSHDSRTILDTTGAERLIGQGDMLFHQPGLAKPVRLQGPFLSDREIHAITDFLRSQTFDDDFVETYGADFDGPPLSHEGGGSNLGNLDFSDPLLKRAAEIALDEGQGSVSRLQRRLSVGHARAGKLMDLLEAMQIVGPHQGSKPREILIQKDELPEYFGDPAR